MMEILILILIYILGCIVSVCLGAIIDVYRDGHPTYPIRCSIFSWMWIIAIIIVISYRLISSGFENLYEWTYDKFKKEE